MDETPSKWVSWSLCLRTSLECVRFWCLARSEALEKALLQPSCSHTYGFSPVWDLRWVLRFSRREYALEQPSNCRETEIDRQTVRESDCLSALLFQSAAGQRKEPGNNGKKKEKALRVSVFKCNLLLEPCPPTVACHTKAKQCYTLVKRAIMWNI